MQLREVYFAERDREGRIKPPQHPSDGRRKWSHEESYRFHNGTPAWAKLPDDPPPTPPPVDPEDVYGD